jgi:hypothetical protein
MANAALEALLEQNRGGVFFLPGNATPKSVQQCAKNAGFAFFHIERQEHRAQGAADEFGGHDAAPAEALRPQLGRARGKPGRPGLGGFRRRGDLLRPHRRPAHRARRSVRDPGRDLPRRSGLVEEDRTAFIVLFSGLKAPKGVSKLTAKE